MKRRLTKTVLVLGASGGIGGAIVRKLVHDGWIVYAHFHQNEQAILTLIKELGKQEDIFPIQADLTTKESVDHLISVIGAVDSIIHAGGMAFEGLLEETSDDVMEKLWNAHLFQPARLIRALLPKMRRREKSSIVFLSSIWGETGASNEVMYSAVKGAQIAFVKALGKELAPSRIRVNAVAPGAVDTSMLARYDDVDRQWIENDIPYGRMANPSEVAGAVAYLVSDDASYVTSHVLSVNGGWYA